MVSDPDIVLGKNDADWRTNLGRGARHLRSHFRSRAKQQPRASAHQWRNAASGIPDLAKANLSGLAGQVERASHCTPVLLDKMG